MTFNEQKWQKWQRLSESIKNDVSRTVNDQALFTEFRTTVMNDAAWLDATMASYFCNFVARTYVAAAALGVRRHVKRDKGSHMNLLLDMAPVAHEVTFDFYLEQFPREAVPWQKPTFRTVSDDGRVLSNTIITADIVALTGACEEVEAFADREVAHADPRGYAGSFTWAELGTAIDHVHEIARKYLVLLTAMGYSSFEAVPQFDWVRSFRQPLLRPETAAIFPEEPPPE
jgi:hypothetical protein